MWDTQRKVRNSSVACGVRWSISQKVHIPLCPITICFELSLAGSELQGRLKYLGTLIKVGFEKSKPTSNYCTTCNDCEHTKNDWIIDLDMVTA